MFGGFLDTISDVASSVGDFVGDAVGAVGDFAGAIYSTGEEVLSAGWDYIDDWFTDDIGSIDAVKDFSSPAAGAAAASGLQGYDAATSTLNAVTGATGSGDNSSFLGSLFDDMDKETKGMILGGIGAAGKQYLQQQQLEELYDMKKDLQQDAKKHHGAYYVKTPSRYPNTTKV